MFRNNSTLFMAAMRLAQEAIKLDNAKQYSEAYEKYVQAVKKLNHFSKFCSNQRLSELAQKKAKQYLARAHALFNGEYDESMNPIDLKIKISPLFVPQKILEFITQQFPESLKDPTQTYEEILKDLLKNQKITTEKIAELLWWTLDETEQYINRIITG